jgi:hypothetical protein
MRAAGIEPAISGMSHRCSAAELRAHGAGRENRTHLAQLGELAPHQSASPAIVPPVGLEPTHFRVRTGCSALELRRRDTATSHATGCGVPPPGIEPEPPGLQPGAQTIYARVASRGVGTPRCHRFVCHGPVGTVSIVFRYERLLGEPSIHLCRSQLPFGLRGSNSHFQVQSLAFCRLNEAREK